jgi:hypothetical protein
MMCGRTTARIENYLPNKHGANCTTFWSTSLAMGWALKALPSTGHDHCPVPQLRQCCLRSASWPAALHQDIPTAS